MQAVLTGYRWGETLKLENATPGPSHSQDISYIFLIHAGRVYFLVMPHRT